VHFMTLPSRMVIRPTRGKSKLDPCQSRAPVPCSDGNARAGTGRPR
jgi:hypothetical protein